MGTMVYSCLWVLQDLYHQQSFQHSKVSAHALIGGRLLSYELQYTIDTTYTTDTDIAHHPDAMMMLPSGGPSIVTSRSATSSGSGRQRR